MRKIPDMNTKTAQPPVKTPAKKASGTQSTGTLTEISEYLRQGVRSGKFVPGQHLLESDLTRQLGCSRGSLRPAMIHLAAEGIITLHRFKGARISIFSRKCVNDLLDVLENLVTYMATTACKNIHIPENRKLIETSIKALLEYAEKGENADYLQKRQEFYDALITVTNNGELRRVVPLFRADLLRVQLQIMQGGSTRKAHAEGYGPIAEAVLEGNPKKAAKNVHLHVSRSRAAVEKIPDSAFPTPE